MGYTKHYYNGLYKGGYYNKIPIPAFQLRSPRWGLAREPQEAPGIGDRLRGIEGSGSRV